MYDVTNQKSFDNIKNQYVIDVEKHANDGMLENMILVGNKKDESSRKVVATESGRLLADNLNIQFMEVSAKTGENIEELFIAASERWLEKNGELLLLKTTKPARKEK